MEIIRLRKKFSEGLANSEVHTGLGFDVHAYDAYRPKCVDVLHVWVSYDVQVNDQFRSKSSKSQMTHVVNHETYEQIRKTSNTSLNKKSEPTSSVKKRGAGPLASW